MGVNLLWVTPDAEKIIGYCARVSNPQNQDNPDVSKLIKYCADHHHWSIFEMANMCLEIETTRAISAQILRHRSFSFQEFSQRYASVADGDMVTVHPRRQDNKNRQNSIDDLPKEVQDWFYIAQRETWNTAKNNYNRALALGIAKESARFLLPTQTFTRLYMNGTIRSWIHYIQLRSDPSTQLEHREIALGAKEIFIKELPEVSRALEWK